MKCNLLPLLRGLVLLLPLTVLAQPTPRVQVTFVEPAHYIDAGDGAADVRRNLHDLERVLRRLGEARLAPGQRLQIDVTQVDLAGRELPFIAGRPEPTRVLNGGADWPRIDLRWRLLGTGGTAEREGQASVDDKTYLLSPIRSSGTESLRYEERMLAQWFARAFETPNGSR